MAGYPLTVRKGDTFKLNVWYLDSNDNPVNVTGYQASFTVWNKDVVVHRASTTSGEVTAGLGGYAIVVDDAVTEAWPSNCWYEFREKDASGSVMTLLEDTLDVTGSIRDGEFVV